MGEERVVNYALAIAYFVVGWILATFVVYFPMRDVRTNDDKFGRDINYAFVLVAWPVWIAIAAVCIPIICLCELSVFCVRRLDRRTSK